VEKTAEAVSEEEKKDEGAVLYAKCAGCHGKDGKTKALGKSELLFGQSKDVLEEKIEAYKSGTRNVAGMGTLMKGQVAGMSEENIEDVSEYISEFK
jgi:cytochrome c553